MAEILFVDRNIAEDILIDINDIHDMLEKDEEVKRGNNGN
jgi:hypothetical protein